jgi:hypothetical protein
MALIHMRIHVSSGAVAAHTNTHPGCLVTLGYGNVVPIKKIRKKETEEETKRKKKQTEKGKGRKKERKKETTKPK